MNWSELDDEHWLRTEQVAEWMGISASYLNKARMEGTGPKFAKLNSSVRYQVKDVRAWANERKRERVRVEFAYKWDNEEHCHPDPFADMEQHEILELF